MYNNSASIIKMSRSLGKEIQKSKAYIEYKTAFKAKHDDEILQGLICEYNLKKIAIDMESKKDSADKSKLKRLNDEMRICYNKITDNENMKSLEEKKARLNGLIKEINDIIFDSVE